MPLLRGSQGSAVPAIVPRAHTTALDWQYYSCGANDLNGPVSLHDQLALGKRKLKAIFGSLPSHTLRAGELLGGYGSSDAIFRLRGGWACQFRDLANGRRAFTDVYLPGDVIGLNAGVRARPLEEVLTLTAAIIETIPADDGLVELITDRSIALYIAFLLCLSQRRSDRLLVAISSLDARGRLAMMLLDFYKRLRSRKLISGSTYNLPLSQVQIGNYLGLTVVHINRVLRSLRSEQIVDLEKHHVTILDLERLVIMARNGGTARCCLSEAADQSRSEQSDASRCQH